MYTSIHKKSIILAKLMTAERPSWGGQENPKTPNTQKDTPRFLPYHPEPSLQWLNALFIDWVDPEKQKDRWRVHINTVVAGGELVYKLQSWGTSSGFQIVKDTAQNNRLYIKGNDSKLIPIKSMEHAMQIMNLWNFIANKSRWLKDGIWNQTFWNILNTQENPVISKWSQIIFKGTINDTVLYSWVNPDFVTPDIAGYLSHNVNNFLKGHELFVWTENTTTSDTWNGSWDPKNILKKLQNI